MNQVYVLDACALIAVLSKGPGDDKVIDIYKKAVNGQATLKMNRMNLLEVYYRILRKYGKDNANIFLEEIDRSPICISQAVTGDIFAEAGKLKATYNISIADSIALAEALASDGILLTADHQGFDAIDKEGKVKFLWIR